MGNKAIFQHSQTLPIETAVFRYHQYASGKRGENIPYSGTGMRKADFSAKMRKVKKVLFGHFKQTLDE